MPRLRPSCGEGAGVRSLDASRSEDAQLVARHVRHGRSPEAARAWALGPDQANADAIAATASRADHTVTHTDVEDEKRHLGPLR